jgi:hypothetical protein
MLVVVAFVVVVVMLVVFMVFIRVLIIFPIFQYIDILAFALGSMFAFSFTFSIFSFPLGTAVFSFMSYSSAVLALRSFTFCGPVPFLSTPSAFVWVS